MGKQYEHLSLDERSRIARLHEAGQSIRQIAAALDRPPSTISRELRRNRGKQVGYRPSCSRASESPALDRLSWRSRSRGAEPWQRKPAISYIEITAKFARSDPEVQSRQARPERGRTAPGRATHTKESVYIGAPVLLARLGSSRHVPRSSTKAGQAHSHYLYRLAYRRQDPVRTSMPTLLFLTSQTLAQRSLIFAHGSRRGKLHRRT
jgi:hypothetical protein